MPIDNKHLRSTVQAYSQDLIAFAQKLVQTPSMPGEEGDVAALVQAEMARLDYDRVEIDEVGNVVGTIAGKGGPALMFNGHMDHVATGDPARWPYPPFGGEIHDGRLWGRGATDMKGAVAAMVYAGGLVKKLGLEPAGDLHVAAVVDEEVGGLGSRHLATTLPVVRAVVGEASSNQLRRGHRGRVELVVRLEGRSVHASMPDLGINPHESMARFVSALPELEMARVAGYPASTVAATYVTSQPESKNITPSEIRLTLDWRNVPGERPDEIVAKLEALLARCLEPGCQGSVEVSTVDLVSYTGVPRSYANIFPSFTTDAQHPWLVQARKSLEAALGREVEVGIWPFATDGGHFAEEGVEVIGFGPGDARVVHTVQEQLPLDELVESVMGYVVLASI